MNSSILKNLIHLCWALNAYFYIQVALFSLALSCSFFVFSFLKKINPQKPLISKVFSKRNMYVISLLITLLFSNLGYIMWSGKSSPILLFGATVSSLILLARIAKKTLSKDFYPFAIFLLALSWLIIVSGYYRPLINSLDHFDLKIGVVKTSLLKLIQSVGLVSILTWLASVTSNKFESKINENKQLNKSTKLILSKIFRVALITLSVFLAMSSVGIDLSIITFLAGAIGVAIGFGLQNIVSNIFCGFIILFDKSIRPGDVITLEDIKTYGIVHKLNARYISIRTREGVEHLIPNEVFISKKTENWTHSDPYIRVSVSFFVSIDSDLDLVEKLLLDIAHRADRVEKNRTPHVRIYDLNSYSVEMRLRVWISDPENGFSSLKSFIYKEALLAFRENNIEMPHPPMNLYFNERPSVYSQKELNPV